MADEKPLYDDGQLKVDYWPRSPEDHYLRVKVADIDREFILTRGILEELVLAPRKEFALKLNAVNDQILGVVRRADEVLKEKGEMLVGEDGLHIALALAFVEDQQRYIRSFFHKE